jgi:hypothetical protein
VLRALTNRADSQSKELHKLRSRRDSLQRKLGVHKQIIDLLGRENIPGLRRLIDHSQKRGESEVRLLCKLQAAAAGKIRIRGGYNKQELDLSFLAMHSSGRFTVAMNRSGNIAAEKTVHKYFRRPQVMVSASMPSMLELNYNISAFFDPNFMTPSAPIAEYSDRRILMGITCMFDNVAVEQRCRWDPVRDVVIGFCREHSQNKDLRVYDEAALLCMKDAVSATEGDNMLCYAKEVTAVAIGKVAPIPPDFTDYAINLVLLSPTCKSEKAPEFRNLLELIERAWSNHPHGARIHGPLWSLASDGDSVSRAAKHAMCTAVLLSEVDPELNHSLKDLEGMNLMVSESGASHLTDPKHIFKCMCTLIRSEEGIVIAELIVTRNDFLDALCSFESIDKQKAETLLDPKDKQNVPKATELLYWLAQVSKLPPPADAARATKRKAVAFLGELLYYFMHPFTDPDLSITDQFVSLFTFSHLAAALQIIHGTSCITGALYADAQATIKCMTLTAARLKLIDDELSYFIILEGSDRLEGHFCTVRTTDHARNFDAYQMGYKSSQAITEQAIYAQYPHLDRGHRRLKVKQSKGVDHLNPKSWKGCVKVGSLDLVSAWKKGREQAAEALASYFPSYSYPNLQFYWEQMKRNRSSYDILRPSGDYIGVRSETADTRSERRETSYDDDNFTDISSDSGSEDDAEEVLQQPIAFSVSQECRELEQDKWPSTASELAQFASSVQTEMYMGVLPSYEAPPPVETIIPLANLSKTIAWNGRTALKETVVPDVLKTGHKQSADRERRVQEGKRHGISDLLSINKRAALTSESEVTPEVDDGTLEQNDLIACLVRSQSGLCLAAFEVKYMRCTKAKNCTSLLWSEIDSSSFEVTIVAQILGLFPDSISPDKSDNHSERWLWEGTYLQPGRQSKGSRSVKHTRASLLVDIPGRLVYPLAPEIIPVTGKFGFSNSQLEEILGDALDTVNPVARDDFMANIALLPDMTSVSELPYVDSNGQCIKSVSLIL